MQEYPDTPFENTAPMVDAATIVGRLKEVLDDVGDLLLEVTNLKLRLTGVSGVSGSIEQQLSEASSGAVAPTEGLKDSHEPDFDWASWERRTKARIRSHSPAQVSSANQ